MAQVIAAVLIKGGSGKVIITMHGVPDIDIDQSGTATLDLPEGDHFIMVGAMPPSDGSIEVSFTQDNESLGSHTFKVARSVPFILEVS